MASVCDTCKSLEAHKYWHDPLIKQEFFKIMIGNFMRKLRIPWKFVECSQGPLAKTCTLRAKSGNVWEVDITRTSQDVIFSKGWGNFVKDHNVTEGDLLVFRCAGDSAFEVSVFDKTGCETEGSYFTQNMNSEISCRSLLHPDNNESENARDTDFSAKKFSAYKMREQECKEKTSFYQENQVKFASSSSCNETGENKGKQIQMHYTSNRRKVYVKEKKEAKKKANSHIAKRSNNSTKPMVQIVMKRSHVSKGFHLTIPQKWATTHMVRDAHEVNLQIPGIQGNWKVGCRWSPTQCHFIRGWPTFVLDNNLEVGDVCVFELVEKGNLDEETNSVMEVYIFRVVEDVVPPTVERG